MPKIGDTERGHNIGKEKGGASSHLYLWQACEVCSKERWVCLIRGYAKTKICSQCNSKKQGRQLSGGKAGKDSGNWKGGRRIMADGYIQIWVHPDDFFASMRNSQGCVREHRLAMARYLGRCLLPWEIVHHKNGIKDDNRVVNLQLLPDKRWHLVDAQTKSYIKSLELQIQQLNGKLREYKV